MTTNRERNYLLAREKAAETLRGLDPNLVAYRSATTYQRHSEAGGMFVVPFGDQGYLVYPEGEVRIAETGREPDITTQILVLHYLITADGHPPADRWIAFRELPEGLIYDAAFQRRTGARLAAAFGWDVEAFVRAAKALGGERLTYGDASFLFRLFPRVNLAVVLHLADEEFPAEANVLFDAAAGHYLPTEDLAVLGGMLAGRLIKAKALPR